MTQPSASFSSLQTVTKDVSDNSTNVATTQFVKDFNGYYPQWIQFTPVISSVTFPGDSLIQPVITYISTCKSYYYTIGKVLYANYNVASSTVSNNGNGYYVINIPPGFTINKSLITTDTYTNFNDNATNFDLATKVNIGAGWWSGGYLVYNTVHDGASNLLTIALSRNGDFKYIYRNGNNFYGNLSGLRMSFSICVPIV